MGEGGLVVALLEPAPEPGRGGREPEERLVGAAEQESGVTDEVKADIRSRAGQGELPHQGLLERSVTALVEPRGAERRPDLRNAAKALPPGRASRRLGAPGVDIVGKQQEERQHGERTQSVTEILTQVGMMEETGELGGEASLVLRTRRRQAPAEEGERPGRAVVERKGGSRPLGQLRAAGAEGGRDKAAGAGPGGDLGRFPPVELRKAANEVGKILEVAPLDQRQIANDEETRDDQEPGKGGERYRRAPDLDLLTLRPQTVEVERHPDLGAREMPMQIDAERVRTEEVDLADQAVRAGQGAVAHRLEHGHRRAAIGPMDEKVDVSRRARERIASEQAGQRRSLERHRADASVHQGLEKGGKVGPRFRPVTMLGQSPPPSRPCARRGRLDFPVDGPWTAADVKEVVAIGSVPHPPMATSLAIVFSARQAACDKRQAKSLHLRPSSPAPLVMLVMLGRLRGVAGGLAVVGRGLAGLHRGEDHRGRGRAGTCLAGPLQERATRVAVAARGRVLGHRVTPNVGDVSDDSAKQMALVDDNSVIERSISKSA